MTYETLNENRGSNTWGGRPVLEELPVRQRNGEQKVFDVLMASLDLVKMFAPLTVNEAGETYAEKVNPRTLKGLSEDSSSLLKGARHLVVYAEFETSDVRTIGIRNGSVGISFVLNKDEESCAGKIEERNADTNTWVKKEGTNIPTGDAVILVKKLLRKFS